MDKSKILATRKYFSFSLAKGGQAYCWGIAEDGTVVCDHMSAELFKQQKLHYRPDDLIWPAVVTTPEDQRHYLKIHRGEKLDDIIQNYGKARSVRARRRRNAKVALSKHIRQYGFYSWTLSFQYGSARFECLAAFGSEKKLTEGPAGTAERFINGLKKPLAEAIFTSPGKKNKATEYLCICEYLNKGVLTMIFRPQYTRRR